MKLSEYIKHQYDASFKEANFPFKIVQKKVKKGEVIYSYYRVGTKIYFLNEGIVETTIRFGDIEKTLSFIFENNFFCAFASALTGEPSTLQGTAITDCIIEEFTYRDYQKACEIHLLANKIGRIEVEKYYLRKFKREEAFLTKTTEEMYLDLINKNPEVIQKVPLKKIANYFGILPETLSRIRKRIDS
ncbi:MAG: cyclic nucleotide-binding domain-containing protein [Chitinophagales bacterium]|nr:cyclic nucleotide-binding domain-containing protein [Chitinophagales bacterium]